MRFSQQKRVILLHSLLAVAMASALMLTGCAKKKPANPAASKPPQRFQETGIASWYGEPYHGRRAANGEIYDMEKMTAAHRTLPFDTVLRVTNLDNGKTTEVRVTDRGPFIDGRIIDLSRAAAREIAMIGPGTARVRIESIRLPSTSQTAAAYGVQVGAFKDKGNAEKLRKQLARSFSPVDVIERDAATRLWRVVVGRKPTAAEAQELADELPRDAGKGFVIRLN